MDPLRRLACAVLGLAALAASLPFLAAAVCATAEIGGEGAGVGLIALAAAFACCTLCAACGIAAVNLLRAALGRGRSVVG